MAEGRGEDATEVGVLALEGEDAAEVEMVIGGVTAEVEAAAGSYQKRNHWLLAVLIYLQHFSRLFNVHMLATFKACSYLPAVLLFIVLCYFLLSLLCILFSPLFVLVL